MATGRLVRMSAAGMGLAALVAAVRAARRRRRAWRRMGRYQDRVATGTVGVRCGRERVYWLLLEQDRLARLISERAEVEPIDERHSRWTLPGPDGVPASCSVEILGDLPELLLAWQVPDGVLPHRGRLEIEPSADPEASVIRAELRYRWSPAWASAAGIADDAPERLLRRTLDRLRLELSRESAGPAPSTPEPANSEPSGG